MSQARGKFEANWRLPAAFGGILALLLVLIICLLFQDNIARFMINPRTPFQTLTPAPTPSYADTQRSWIFWPEKQGAGAADIFYIHSTTSYSRRHWNAAIDDPKASSVLETTAAANEAGPFLNLGSVYGPRYRQATLFSFFTHKYDGVAARRAAYEDVNDAFDVFLENSTDPERPIIIAGYGQGGLHALGLLQRRINKDDVLRKRIAAAYVIDHAVPEEFFSAYAPNLSLCDSRDDYRCVVAFVALETGFDDEIRRARKRMMVWNERGELVPSMGNDPVCVNPLTWRATNDYVGPEHHLGAASATGLKLGSTPPPVSRALGAQCQRGVLVVDRPRQEYLRRSPWFAEKWKSQHFNLFYHDVAEDAARRIALTQRRLTAEAEILAPIDQAVDLGASPIKKVPK